MQDTGENPEPTVTVRMVEDQEADRARMARVVPVRVSVIFDQRTPSRLPP